MDNCSTILWDFDGVIFDSMKIKCDGFKSLFNTCSDDVLQQIESYHYTHGGVSRFDKIRYFYEVILEQKISDEKVMLLADIFSKNIEAKLFDKNNLIEDSVDFIKKNYLKYHYHIVSGAEDKELNHLCEVLGLSGYFKSIDGSPTKKDILVKNVLRKYQYEKNKTILIGDAMTDYDAAMQNDIGFYGYNNKALKKFNYIDSFRIFDA